MVEAEVKREVEVTEVAKVGDKVKVAVVVMEVVGLELEGRVPGVAVATVAVTEATEAAALAVGWAAATTEAGGRGVAASAAGAVG